MCGVVILLLVYISMCGVVILLPPVYISICGVVILLPVFICIWSCHTTICVYQYVELSYISLGGANGLLVVYSRIDGIFQLLVVCSSVM